MRTGTASLPQAAHVSQCIRSMHCVLGWLLCGDPVGVQGPHWGADLEGSGADVPAHVDWQMALPWLGMAVVRCCECWGWFVTLRRALGCTQEVVRAGGQLTVTVTAACLGPPREGAGLRHPGPHCCTR